MGHLRMGRLPKTRRWTQVVDLLDAGSLDTGELAAAVFEAADLRIKRGAITGIIGPNGAGKTTLFNLVSGAMSPTSGQVIFDGRRIDKMGMLQTFGLGLVCTFQIPREMKRMTVLENLILVPAPQTGEHIWASWLMPRKVAREERQIEVQAMEVLELLTLSHLADEYAGNLSGGQKKLLELARVLMASTPGTQDGAIGRTRRRSQPYAASKHLAEHTSGQRRAGHHVRNH